MNHKGWRDILLGQGVIDDECTKYRNPHLIVLPLPSKRVFSLLLFSPGLLGKLSAIKARCFFIILAPILCFFFFSFTFHRVSPEINSWLERVGLNQAVLREAGVTHTLVVKMP